MNLFGILTIDAVTFLWTFKTTQVISCFDTYAVKTARTRIWRYVYTAGTTQIELVLNKISAQPALNGGKSIQSINCNQNQTIKRRSKLRTPQSTKNNQ